MINVTINGHPYQVRSDLRIFEACQSVGIYIPSICHHDLLPPSGKCRVCIVKINNETYTQACVLHVAPNMIIDTMSPDVLEKQRKALETFINTTGTPPGKDIEDVMNHLFPHHSYVTRTYERTNSITFDPKNCILCGRCIRMCSDIQAIGALNESNPRLKENECISCGQCIVVCPTSALTPTPAKPLFLHALSSRMTLVLQVAPAVRVTVGELFGDPIGSVCTSKIISAARQLGFQYVFDTQFGADSTIIEEGTELISRIKNNGPLPLFTLCCPAWVNFAERHHPELLKNLSTAKSPHMMVGKLIKSYFAQIKHINPSTMM